MKRREFFQNSFLLSSFSVGAEAQTRPALSAFSSVHAAFLYVGSIGRSGWSYAHEIARKKTQEYFGVRLETSVHENVPENLVASNIMREAIKKGADVIFATTYGYAEQLALTAQFFPHIAFEHCNGISTKANVRTYAARAWEGAYLAGYLAASKSQNGCIGVIGSFPISEIIRSINAYALGAKAANSKCKVILRWADVWYDPNLEMAIADRLFKEGVDVVYQLTDSEAVLPVAEKYKKFAIVSNSDMSFVSPSAHLGVVAIDWSPYYIKSIRDCLSKSWRTNSNEWGMLENSVDLFYSEALTGVALSSQIAKMKHDLLSNKLRVWSGPIVSQAGRLMADIGDSISPKALSEMDWLVSGIEGYLPTRR
jgi:basic membrane protein A